MVFFLLRFFFFPFFSQMRNESKGEGTGQDFQGTCRAGSSTRPIRGNRVRVHPCSPLPKTSSLINHGFGPPGQTEVLVCEQIAAHAHSEAVFLLQEDGLGKIQGIRMQKSFNANCLAGTVTLKNDFKPRAGHRRRGGLLPRAMPLAPPSTHPPNGPTLAH